MTAVLYISTNGLMEPLGRSQIWSYLSRLAKNHRIFLVTSERTTSGSAAETKKMEAETQRVGVQWEPVYRDGSSKWDAARALHRVYKQSLRLVKENDIALVHARSHTSALIALRLKSRVGLPFLFDLRGYKAESRVDAGLWRRGGLPYRLFSWVEERSLGEADAVVCLTRRAARSIKDRTGRSARSVHVVPTCVDLDLFSRRNRAPPRTGFTLGYVGSVKGRYRFRDVVDCYKQIKDQDADTRFLVLNRNDHDHIRATLRAADVPLDHVELRSVEYDQVPGFLSQMDAGLFLYPDRPSSEATSPTKMGELLACGVPCMTNSAVGDAAEILEGSRVGVVLNDDDLQDRREAVERLVALTKEPGIQERCRRVAVDQFSLDLGVKTYDKIYQSFGRDEA